MITTPRIALIGAMLAFALSGCAETVSTSAGMTASAPASSSATPKPSDGRLADVTPAGVRKMTAPEGWTIVPQAHAGEPRVVLHGDSVATQLPVVQMEAKPGQRQARQPKI